MCSWGGSQHGMWPFGSSIVARFKLKLVTLPFARKTAAVPQGNGVGGVGVEVTEDEKASWLRGPTLEWMHQETTHSSG